MSATRRVSAEITPEEKTRANHVRDQLKVTNNRLREVPSQPVRTQKKLPSPLRLLVVVFIGICTAFFLHVKTSNTIAYLNSIESEMTAQSMIFALEHKEEEVMPKKNSLYIPKLDVLTLVTEGEYEDEKKYTQAWRRTHTSSPEKGGNTVIVGHRYRDNTPDYPLYDIDQISTDDEIVVYWDEKKYTYIVYNTLEVHETAIEIEDDTDESLLTLYACDWTGKRRLVVQAKLVQE